MKNSIRAVIMIFLLCVISGGLLSCVPLLGKGEVIIHADGSGKRIITVSIDKQEKDSSDWGVSYYFLKIHGSELEDYLRKVYSEESHGSEEWLTVSVDDSGSEAEIITLSFEFSSFDEYNERLAELVVGNTASSSEVVIKTDGGEIVSYKESIGVIMSIEQSMLEYIAADDTVFDVSCTRDGKALSTQPLSNILRYGVQSLDDYADEPCFVLFADGNRMEIMSENSQFFWCKEGYMDPADMPLTVSKADEWTALFRRYGEKKLTWIGADGVYSFALDGNDAFASADDDTDTFFIFSDTLFGTSSSDGKRASRNAMPNHSGALLKGSVPIIENRSFVWGKNGSCPLDLGELGNTSLKNFTGSTKWFTDGLVLRDKLYLFCYTPIGLGNLSVDMAEFRIKDGEIDFGSCKVTESIPQLCHLGRQGELLIDYGYGVHVNTAEAGAPDPDGYIYIYGGGAAYEGYVSRIKAEDFPDFSKLRYWNGSEWCENIADSAKILDGISREYSVTPVTVGPHKGKYIAVYMEDCISGNIVYSFGETPYGPFEMPVRVYSVPENGEKVLDGNGKDDSIFTYNAKAHPHLSEGDRLLVSYNTNVGGGSNTPYSYHPRFIWIDLDVIGDPQEETEVISEETEVETAVVTEPDDKSEESDETEPENQPDIDEKPDEAGLAAVLYILIMVSAVLAVGMVIVIIKKKK